MEVLAKGGGSIVSGIIEFVIQRLEEKAQEHWLGSRSKIKSALQNIQNRLSLIKVMIHDSNNRAYIDSEPAVKAWMESLHDIICDVDKVLDQIEYRIINEKFNQENKLISFMLKFKPFSIFESDMIMIEKLDEIEKKLVGLTQMVDSYNLKVVADHQNSSTYKNIQKWETTSIFNKKVVGRDDIIDQLIKRLTQDNPTIHDEHILSITGMGGIGKTTLAQMVYNHEKVKSYFELKIWVCVSCGFDEMKIIIKILESVSYSLGEKGESVRNNVNLDVLTKTLIDKLEKRRYFLVLDDVWNENPIKWQKIAYGLKIDDRNKGSKVLVTTRNNSVAKIVSSSKPIQLDGLSEDVLWDLMKTFVFGGMEEKLEELEPILRKITSNLKGSPLAAKTVGHILKSNPNKRHWEHILSSKIWALKQMEEDITPALMLSYQNLPGYLKPCFAFCSLYPEDYVYERKEIVLMWMALGYIVEESETKPMEDFGEEYVKELLDRSMFQPCTEDDVQHKYKGDPNEWFKIHDLVHGVAKMVSANDSLMIHDECTMKQLSSSIRNLSICIDDEDWCWKGHDSFDCFNNVRTLIFLSKNGDIQLGGGLKDFLEKALLKMKFLRILDIRRVHHKEIPLHELKHLRYLKLSRSVVALSISWASLYQLQVLECLQFFPPRPIRYSENLRHLSGFTFNINFDPFLEKFHFLRELDLDVSKPLKLFSRKKKETGHHKLKALRAMKWIQELSICGLEDVDSKEEALEAELKSKDRLTKLTLRWCEQTASVDRVNEILEALHPGPNVTVLEIDGWNGTECPGWMESLSLLRELKVNLCENLKLIRTRGLKMIKRLELTGCGKLRVEDGFKGFAALNTLEELRIDDCDRLIADLFTEGRGGLPSSLRVITIAGSGRIINVSNTIMQSLTNLTELSIRKDSVDVPVDSVGVLAPSPINPPEAQKLQQLRSLYFSALSAEVKGWLLYLQGCTALVEILLYGCSALLFDTQMEDALARFVSLRHLRIHECNDFHSLPSRLCELSSLTSLSIVNCPNISCLPLEGGLPPRLQLLSIWQCPLLAEYVEKVGRELNDGGWYVEANMGGIKIKREP